MGWASRSAFFRLGWAILDLDNDSPALKQCAPVSRSLLSPLVALALMAVWISPGVNALALGLHVALDHHDHADGRTGENEEHDISLAEVAQAAVHGHHHSVVAASAHEHRATVHGAGSAPCQSSTSLAIFPTIASAEALIEGSRAPARTVRRGPPDPLFTRHCSLLL